MKCLLMHGHAYNAVDEQRCRGAGRSSTLASTSAQLAVLINNLKCFSECASAPCLFVHMSPRPLRPVRSAFPAGVCRDRLCRSTQATPSMASLGDARYHVAPTSGWINDPNGPLHRDGLTHMCGSVCYTDQGGATAKTSLRRAHQS